MPHSGLVSRNCLRSVGSVRMADNHAMKMVLPEPYRPVMKKPRSLDDDLETLKKYNEQRRAAGLEPLTYGVWRSRGAPEEYA